MAKYVNAGKEGKDGVERQEVSVIKHLFWLHLGVTIRWLTVSVYLHAGASWRKIGKPQSDSA